ncbi:MAG TPA: NrsF family protein [Bryobacteraceae bacterium]|nr:NrsF family protein [Bryobacteraceae bacterium]
MAKLQPPDTKIDEKIDRLLELAPAPELSPDLHRRISGALAASLQPVKPMPAARVLAGQFAAIFLVFAASLIAMMGVTGFRTLDARQALGILTILAVGVALLPLVLAWQVIPGSQQKIPPRLAWACFGVGFLTGAALLFPWRGVEAFVSRGWPCLLAGSAVAVPGGILFWLLSRRGVPLSAGTFGGTLGAIAGLLGLTVLQFRCIYQDVAHLLVWHGGVLVLSITAGVLVALAARR